MYDVKQHLSLLDSSNWTEWKAGLADDVIYEEIATNVRVTGADAYLKTIQRWKQSFPDLRARVLSTATAGNKILAEVEWEGTLQAPLDGPFGTIAPTNKKGTLRGALITTVENDKVVEVHSYFDMLTMLSNLGVNPLAVPPGQGAKPAPSPAPQRH